LLGYVAKHGLGRKKEAERVGEEGGGAEDSQEGGDFTLPF